MCTTSKESRAQRPSPACWAQQGEGSGLAAGPRAPTAIPACGDGGSAAQEQARRDCRVPLQQGPEQRCRIIYKKKGTGHNSNSYVVFWQQSQVSLKPWGEGVCSRIRAVPGMRSSNSSPGAAAGTAQSGFGHGHGEQCQEPCAVGRAPGHAPGIGAAWCRLTLSPPADMSACREEEGRGGQPCGSIELQH